ncbi:MAG: S8 family serine peptidase [Bacteroidia bacterium]
MKKLNLLNLLTILMFGFTAKAQQDYRIMLHSGANLPASNLEEFITSAQPATDEIFDGYFYRFVQFNVVPNDGRKNVIAQDGIILLNYIPHNTFMAAIPANYDRNNLRNYDIRSVVSQNFIQKINTSLLGTLPTYAIKEKGFVDVIVQYQKNISLLKVQEVAQLSGTILGTSAYNHSITLRIPENSIEVLAQLPWVLYMDAIAPASTPDDTKGRSLHRSNVINSDYVMGRHYDGTGVAAALADDGIVGPHIDFTGRLTNHLTIPGGFHGDMTSGILAGAGNLDPVIRGMATGVQLHVFDIGPYPQIIDAVLNNATLGTTVSSTSYSQGCNEYTTDTQFGDQTIHDNPQLEFVFSAGNNGGGDCGYGAGAGWGNVTGGYKQGKNVIACANLSPLEVLDPSSSRGPASDGRIKPDISANGLDQMSTAEGNTYQVGGGTSAACPGIAGICTQLIQAYKEINSAANAPTALIKACLLNGAEDIGNAGPDYTYGWGRVNALRAVETIEDVRYFNTTISQGITNTHTIAVPANVIQLRVMAYWHDQAGTPLAAISLTNDLDMVVTDPSSFVWEPWILDPTPNPVNLNTPAIRATDHLNNMEQVTIDNPAAGNYTVSINGFAVPQGPQEYYLVYEFRTDDITVTYPLGGEGFVPGEQEVIRWDALKGLGNYTLEYSTDDGATWNNIATNVSGTDLQYAWTIPNTITGEARVRVSRGAVTGTNAEKFSIIGTPQNLAVDWACPDSIRLIWDAVPGAVWYEVSRLGAFYMDSIGTSVTNNFIVTGTNPANEYWFSCRAVLANGVRGRRAYAINKQPGTLNCPLALDVQLDAVISPGAGTLMDCQDNSAVMVTVQIENRGMNSVSNVPVSYSLNGATPVSDVYTGTLAPMALANFSFPATIDLSLAGIYSLQAWVDFPGDLNIYNDSSASVTDVIPGTTVVVPFIEDFESSGLCSTIADCEATSCPIANGWLNETNLVQDDIDFRVNEGATPSLNTGPDVDHTSGTATGNYIYLEPSIGCTGRSANLISPCIDLTASVAPQMIFWYHMYGAAMGTLAVDIYNNGTWTNNVILPIAGDQGNLWHLGVVNLAPYIGDVINVRFRGVTGNNFTSDLALDDINILETNAPPVVQFNVNFNTGCVGKTFTFNDQSLNAPTSWLWTFTPNTVMFVNGTSATSQNPQVQFIASGMYDVTLMATNGFGSTSSTQSAYISISSPAIVPLIEDFQSAAFPPAGWMIDASGGAFTWANATGITGSNGVPTDAAYMDNFDYNNPGAEDGLETFETDITSVPSGTIMTFDVAYARYSAVFTDTLRIDISTDCGDTYVPTSYYKGGTDLATVPDQNALWIPAAGSDWRNDTLDLAPYTGTTAKFKFVNINGFGNSMYLDNINIHFPTGIIENIASGSISVFPNPSSGIFNLMIQSPKEEKFNISITDMNGRIVSSREIAVAGLYSSKIDLKSYAKGIYSVAVKSNERVYRTRVVIL